MNEPISNEAVEAAKLFHDTYERPTYVGQLRPVSDSTQPLSFSQLIARVGDKHIVLQNILHSSAEITECRKDGRVAFYTELEKARDLIQQAAYGREGEWTALVVWLPTKRLKTPDAERSEE